MRLIVADPGLVGPRGHHQVYCEGLAAAAQARGMEAVVLAGRGFTGLLAGGTIACRACFAESYRAAGSGGLLRHAAYGGAALLPERPAGWLAEGLQTARRWITRPDSDGFAVDLATGLAALGETAGDILLLPSISAANLAGLPGRLNPGRIGRLAVVLRRPPEEMDLDERGPEPVFALLRRLHEIFGRVLRLHADTPTLVQQFATGTGLPIGLLPLPVRLAAARGHERQGRPPKLLFPGGARVEKGYGLLPGLHDRLQGRAHIIVHSGPIGSGDDPRVQRAHRALRHRAETSLSLRLVEQSLPAPDYARLLAEADVILLPYDARRYGPRSSHVMAEARALGIPAVVPGGTWMAEVAVQPRRVVFAGPAGFAGTVEGLLTALDEVAGAWRDAAPAWRRANAPDAVLAAVLRGLAPARDLSHAENNTAR